MIMERIKQIKLNPNYWNCNQFIEFRLLGLPVVWMKKKEIQKNQNKKSIYIFELKVKKCEKTD